MENTPADRNQPPEPTSERAQACADREAYTAIASFVVASDYLRWTRFNNYLVFNTILVLAWATIYVSGNNPRGARLVLIVMTLFGIGSGLIWAAIGHRGGENHKAWAKEGIRIEESSHAWRSTVTPCKRALDLGPELPHSWAGAYFLLSLGPLAFVAFHIVLLVVSVLR